MSLELAANFLAFFIMSTASASLFGIAVDRGLRWYRDTDGFDAEI